MTTALEAATDRIVRIARLRPDLHRKDRVRRDRIRAELATLLGEPEPAVSDTAAIATDRQTNGAIA